MEKYLKAIIVAGLLIMPWQYFFSLKMQNARDNKQMIENLKGSIERFSDGKKKMYEKLLEIQINSIKKENQRLSFLLPSFSNARANLLAPFDKLRKSVNGSWHVVPEGKFIEVDQLVFWPFKFTFNGSASNAIKAIAHIETSDQFMRLRNYVIETDINSNVKMEGLVELVFHTTDRLVDREEVTE